MTVQEVRELLRLAEQVGGSLACDYRGMVVVDGVTEPERGCGDVSLGALLMFVGPDDPDGEGWEHCSAREGRSLRKPRVLLKSGEAISIETARQMVADLERAIAAI